MPTVLRPLAKNRPKRWAKLPDCEKTMAPVATTMRKQEKKRTEMAMAGLDG